MSNLVVVFCPKGELFELSPQVANKLVTVLGWSFKDKSVVPIDPSLEDILSVKSTSELKKIASADFGVVFPRKAYKEDMIQEIIKLSSMSAGKSKEPKSTTFGSEESSDSDNYPINPKG